MNDATATTATTTVAEQRSAYMACKAREAAEVHAAAIVAMDAAGAAFLAAKAAYEAAREVAADARFVAREAAEQARYARVYAD